MGACAECRAETQFEWVRPDVWKQKIEQGNSKPPARATNMMRL